MTLALPLLTVLAWPLQERAGLSQEQMAADLEQLAAAVEDQWAYFEARKAEHGIDARALVEDAIARLAGVRGDAEFVGLVRELVASLRDGHAFVQWGGAEDIAFRRWPFLVEDTADGLVIRSVLAPWTGAPPDVAPGDVLLEVDGVPVEERIALAERRTNASTDGSRRKRALSSSVFNRTDPSRYAVRRADGTEAVIEAHAAAGLPEAEPRSATLESRRLSEGVAYLRISTFAHSNARAWTEASPAQRPGLLAQDRKAIRAAFASAAGCKALVLDLRGNGGGTDLLAMEVAACLLPEGSVYYGLASRRAPGRWSKPSYHRFAVEGEPPRFAGQLVVLIDEDTFSAADNLCRCLDDLHPDVTFVGRPTGGGTGAPRPAVTLEHSGITVAFCTMRVTGPKGELIEGAGTLPDVPVRPTRESVLAGRDLDLEAALRAVR